MLKSGTPNSSESWERELNNIRIGTRQNYKEKLVAEGILQQLKIETLGVIDKCQSDISKFRSSAVNATSVSSRNDSLFTPGSRSLSSLQTSRHYPAHSAIKDSDKSHDRSPKALEMALEDALGRIKELECMLNQNAPHRSTSGKCHETEDDLQSRIVLLEGINSDLTTQLEVARSECSSSKARIIELEGLLDGITQRGLRDPLKQLTRVSNEQCDSEGLLESASLSRIQTPSDQRIEGVSSMSSSVTSSAVAKLLATVERTLSSQPQSVRSVANQDTVINSSYSQGPSGSVSNDTANSLEVNGDTKLVSWRVGASQQPATSRGTMVSHAATPQKLDREFMM